jgi:hypothetical protein
LITISFPAIPAKAETHIFAVAIADAWVPAFAGMDVDGISVTF